MFHIIHTKCDNQGNRQVRAPYGEINGSHSAWYSFLIHSYLWQVVKDKDSKQENRDSGMRHNIVRSSSSWSVLNQTVWSISVTVSEICEV